MCSAGTPERRARPVRPPVRLDALREQVPDRRPPSVGASVAAWVGALAVLGTAAVLAVADSGSIRSALVSAASLDNPTTSDAEITRTVDLTLAGSGAVAGVAAVVAVVGVVRVLGRQRAGRTALTVDAAIMALGGAAFYLLAADAGNTAVQTLPVVAAALSVVGAAILHSPAASRWFGGSGRLLAR